MPDNTEEGYIKFHGQWIKTNPLPKQDLSKIIEWRDKLFSLGLLGAYDNGIGFGNISVRSQGNTFAISGSATGHLKKINNNHFVLVTQVNYEKNSLVCEGPVMASSESLSHAMIYESSDQTNAVIHIHHLKMWQTWLGQAPTTDKNAAYGTLEMAMEIKKLIQETDFKNNKFFVMGGHREGIISFGTNLDEAGNILLSLRSQLLA